MPLSNGSNLTTVSLTSSLRQHALIKLSCQVDLIYAHRPDRNTPIEETVRAFNHLIDTGKAFYWGTSEWNADEIASAWGVAQRLNLIGPLMEQPQYNMLDRSRVELEYSLLYEQYGTGLTIFSPLKIGILTGKYNDGVPEDSRLATSKDDYTATVKKKVGDRDWQLVIEKVKSLQVCWPSSLYVSLLVGRLTISHSAQPVVDKLGVDQAALALAWVLKNPRVSSAITGASKVEQIHSSIRALDVVPKLTDEIMAEIDGILKNKPVALTRRF